MNPLKHVLNFSMALALACSLHAQMPPAEQLLPDDTFAVFTVPDWTKMQKAQAESSWGQLWADPAMKPFRDNFVSNFTSDFLRPLEKELGLSLSNYWELLQGQVTLALLPPKQGSSTEFASLILLVDAKDKAETLKSRVAELKKKWSDSGKETRSEKIRDVEFTVVSFSRAEVDAFLQKAFPSEDKEEEQSPSKEKIDLLVGQHKSLLIVSEDSKAVEKVLARQAGGLVPPLAEQAAYQKSHSLLFRDSVAHGWLNFKPIYDKIMEFAGKEQQAEEAPPGMPAMKLDKILPALGLGSLQTISAKASSSSEGSMFELFVGAPESQREGVFKLLTLEKKDSAPPAFVPADAIKFQRTRIDAQKAWATLEGVLAKIDPSLAGLVQLMLQSAGKDQDPNFDLKKNLIGNLGDDFIQYQKAPRGKTPAELAAPPALVLVGSPNAPALVDAIRMVTSLLPPQMSGEPLKEREFLGRKVYSITLPTPPSPEGEEGGKEAAPPMLSFTASGGYAAFSADIAILEEYLRSGENPPKPLRSLPGLAEAAQKAGGMESGYFTFDNQAESVRITMETLKEDPEAFGRTIFFALSRGEAGGEETFSRFFDLKLLPSYERIAKYFGIAIGSASTTADGFVVKAYGPRPAGMAK